MIARHFLAVTVLAGVARHAAADAAGVQVDALRCQAVHLKRQAAFVGCLARCAHRSERRSFGATGFDPDRCHGACRMRYELARARPVCASADGTLVEMRDGIDEGLLSPTAAVPQGLRRHRWHCRVRCWLR